MADPLLQPLRLNSITLKNRIFSSAHAPAGYVGEGGVPGERYALYQEEKARGGIGLTMFGGSSAVSLDSLSHFGSINAGSDAVLPFYADVAERVHRHDSHVMVQITHIGRRGDDHSGHWLPTVGPSAIRERAHRSYPKAMEDFDFPRILEDYAAAALRAKRGGLDGVEIAGLAGHLVDQFLAPRSNQRDDMYGGSLENRARFVLEIVHAVREAVGSDFVVGIRLPGDEGVNGGIGPGEAVDIARMLTATGALDYISTVYGAGFTHRELADVMPPFGRELGAHLPVASRIKEAVDVPVFHAGRIADLATARHALREDLIDLVGMTRAHIADPHIVRKIERREEDRIRPCVGASYCLNGVDTLCLHNPSTGREATIPQLVSPTAGPRRKVVVVGGGPGGLEAARVSAERGHDVVLFEAASQVGGQVLTMSRPHRQSEKRSISEWLAAEARFAGAELRTGRYAEADDVLAESPDVVIVATGGLPDTELPEGGERFVVSTADVLNRPAPTGKDVIVYDAHGGEQAATTAEYLAEAGNRVRMLTIDDEIGHDITHTVRPDYLRILTSNGVVTESYQELLEVRRSGGRLEARLRHTYNDIESTREADLVVVEQGTIPIDEVYAELRTKSANRGQIDLMAMADASPQPVPDPGGGFSLFRIGDAVAHRGVHAAIYDARRLCMGL
ncbi:N-methylproline demethylase [Aeromicrobium sp. PE09-221]|uniref:NADH:flavin oxidoreductase n=1 Tax=Aeromicrobium sp. PE09-221 TaxID=1898043 RepID=UPI000B3EA40A|nr:NADH:flavin oxidoreductase [Aeromicrobium sp. PE09-221]OUZ11714.1 N-methylproline demethylase [Aeromicrobium sp. PE09-221]